MDRYIKVYDNVLSEEKCLHYINLIENTERQPGKFVAEDGRHTTTNNEVKDSEDMYISWTVPEELPFLMQLTMDLITRYEKDTNSYIPCESVEPFIGRVYREKQGHYITHIDCASPATYSRMLTILFYLNDIYEGGELVFEKHDLSVQPRVGRVVLFPSYWMYNHAAKPSLKGDRYIMRTFVKGKE